MKFEQHEYTIPSHSLGYFINGDMDGYTDQDLQEFKSFEQKLIKRHGNANVVLMDEQQGEAGFLFRNDINTLGADCTNVIVLEKLESKKQVKVKSIVFKSHSQRIEHFESMLNNYVNGNLSDFRSQLSQLSTKEVINFIGSSGENTNYSIEEMFLIVQKFIIN
jgi:hypothetical protein